MLFGILAVLAGYGLYKIATDSDDGNDRYDDDDGYYASSSSQQAQAAARAAQERQYRDLLNQAMAHANAVQSDFDTFEKLFEGMHTSINGSQMYQLEQLPERRLRHVMYKLINNPKYLTDQSAAELQERWLKELIDFTHATGVYLDPTEEAEILLEDFDLLKTNIAALDEIIEGSEALEEMLLQLIAEYEATHRNKAEQN